jgi:hypothetical protein
MYTWYLARVCTRMRWVAYTYFARTTQAAGSTRRTTIDRLVTHTFCCVKHHHDCVTHSCCCVAVGRNEYVHRLSIFACCSLPYSPNLAFLLTLHDACLAVCWHVRSRVCVCAFVCSRVRMCVGTYVRMCARACVCVCVCVCVRVCNSLESCVGLSWFLSFCVSGLALPFGQKYIPTL